MSDTVLRVRDLGKRYRLGEIRPGIRTFREALVHLAAAPVRRAARAAGDDGRTLWALRKVAFDVARGEVVGVIGRNGAGKSTLLKILSRITEPTEGWAEVHGRVGSLLEVGAGFHGELTGRENIYLNGAILGMRRREIARRFDGIVAFAEIEKFLDTPVKHYSSGMYLRLAFAVAAHLEPDILIVDEVLAVGDVQFQKKCLGKMQSVSRGEGRTVLFVSHSMDAIQRLCSRCLVLDGGALIADADSVTAVARYLAVAMPEARPEAWIDVSRVNRTGTGQARVVAVRYTSGLEAVGGQPYAEGPLAVTLAIDSDAARPLGSLAVTLYSTSGTKLVNADTLALGRVLALRAGRTVVTVRIDTLHLNPGVYRLGLWLADPINGQKARGVYDSVESAFELEVVALGAGGLGATAPSAVPCRFDVVEPA